MTADQPDEGYAARHAATGCTTPFHTTECQDYSTPPVVSAVTADRVTTAAGRVGWVEFVTADDAAMTHIAYVHEDGSVYLPEGHDVVTWETFRLTVATDRFWPLVRRPDRPAPQVNEGAQDPMEESRPAWAAAFKRYPDDTFRSTHDRILSRVAFTEGWAARDAAAPAVPQVNEGAMERAARTVTAEQVEAAADALSAWMTENATDIVLADGLTIALATLGIEVTR